MPLPMDPQNTRGITNYFDTTGVNKTTPPQKVEAMSTEKRVRVRVKLYDDKTDIYSQDIDMSTGEGGFIVPTVMADAPYVNLQIDREKKLNKMVPI
uniref:SFRICE_025487 n=1 Tax=Spodoptera frugiperda TaxID=7108 RepID=A0A2H1VFX8_SPOFR